MSISIADAATFISLACQAISAFDGLTGSKREIQELDWHLTRLEATLCALSQQDSIKRNPDLIKTVEHGSKCILDLRSRLEPYGILLTSARKRSYLARIARTLNWRLRRDELTRFSDTLAGVIRTLQLQLEIDLR